MIDVALLNTYLIAITALILIPGPDMLIIISSSLNYGKKTGYFAAFGIASSGIILSLLTAIGVAALMTMTPLFLLILTLSGGIYLLKIGLDSIGVQTSVLPTTTDNKMPSTYYKRAFISNLLNPKALLFFVLFLPQFVSDNITASYAEQLLALGLLLNTVALVFNLLLVTLVGTLGSKLLENEKFRIYQHKTMGCVFILLAIWMLISALTNSF